MQTVDSGKLVERAAAVGLITMGITGLAGVFIIEDFNLTISVFFGLLLIGIVVVGVHKRVVALMKQRGFGRALTVLAILVPLGAALSLGFYPVLFGFVLALGASLPAGDWIALGISALAALANLIVLVRNLSQVLRGRSAVTAPGFRQ